jgi:putative membrane protein
MDAAALAMVLPSFHMHWDVLSLVVVLEGGYLVALRRLGPAFGPPGGPPAERKRVVCYSLGVLAIWIAASWPVHDLAEHYLFSVHMVQHLLLSLVAPPLMLLGMPEWLLRWLLRPRPVRAVVRVLTRPFVAFVLFNLVIVVTHWPAWVDATLVHHWFHFVSHTILFTAATLMWWPVISPLPEMPGLSYPGRMVYLFLQSILPTVPASFLTFGHTVLYPFYAHVPRIWGMSALTDQLIAGLTMKIAGGAILWTVIAVIFFRWHREERDNEGWDALKFRDVERDIRSELTKR